MTRKLRVLTGPDKDKVFDLPATGTVLIGRSKETLTKLRDDTVSRKHCELEVTVTGVLVTNASESGTLVNDQPVTRRELVGGEIIRLGEAGNTRLLFETPDLHEDKTVRGDKLVNILGDELKGLLGRTLGTYRLTGLVAEGVSGMTFRAQDTQQPRDAAVKVFLPNPSLVAAFQQLRPVLAARHPNLVALYETGTTDGYSWAAMEYVEGTSLEKQLEQAGATGWVDWRQVLRYALHLASGLDALHQKQILHGGLTPGRVLITRSNREAKLGGLWRARPRDAAQADVKDDLRHLAYVPPERVRPGRPSRTAGGDVYSLGAVLYHLLAGRPPFEEKDQGELIRRIIQAVPPAPGEFQFGIPEALERAVLRMLAKEPEDRYRSAAEVLTDLERIRDRPVSPPPPPPAYPAPQVIIPPRPEDEPRAAVAVPAPRQVPVVVPPPDRPAAVEEKRPAPLLVPPAPRQPPVPAPVPAGEGMMSARCSCGRTLHARRQFAGTRVRCPACSNFVVLPGRPMYTQLTGPSSQTRLPAAPVQASGGGGGGSWKVPANQQPAGFLSEFARYLLLVVLLVGTLLLSLSGVVCSVGPEPPPPPGNTKGQPGQPDKAGDKGKLDPKN